MKLHKSLGWADKRTCNLIILPIQSNFTQESFLIVICMYLYACYIQKKVTCDLKELFLQVNIADKKRSLESSLQINYKKLFFFECCAGISNCLGKNRTKFFFLRFGFKQLRGVINQALKKKVCVLVFLSLLVTLVMDTLLESLGVCPYGCPLNS